MRTKICSVASTQVDSIRELRHRLHGIPELGMVEHKTCALLRHELAAMDLSIRTLDEPAGLVADLKTARPGKTVVLRADMDGLPVEEATGASYASRHEGQAHACGHDGHAACLVGAARVLSALRADLCGTVRFVFQPAEEISAGARTLVRVGALEDPPADAIIALHTWPGLPPDTVASVPGPMMASCDMFTVHVRGRGGHGARPHLARNPLLGISSLTHELSRVHDSLRVISPCVVQAGEKANVIAETGILSGTVRALTAEARDRTLAELHESVERICTDLGMKGDVRLEVGCPRVENDPRLYDLFREVGCALLGPDRTQLLDGPSMGSEDFGYYLQHIPGMMFRLGAGIHAPQLHHPTFNFNDDSLETGMTMLAGLAMRFCTGTV